LRITFWSQKYNNCLPFYFNYRKRELILALAYYYCIKSVVDFDDKRLKKKKKKKKNTTILNTKFCSDFNLKFFQFAINKVLLGSLSSWNIKPNCNYLYFELFSIFINFCCFLYAWLQLLFSVGNNNTNSLILPAKIGW